MNYFELLAIDEKYDIDPASLNKQYFARLAKYHPDRALSPEQKREHQELSININKAYATLKDDLKRAEHILNLHNIATDEIALKNKISKEKLTEIWEQYDRLDDVNQPSSLNHLLDEKQTEYEKLATHLEEAFKNNNFNDALDIIISFKYLVTLIESIKSKIKNANNRDS